MLHDPPIDSLLFQSTLPVKGATLFLGAQAVVFAISIHAPREGSDSPYCKRLLINADFNPRSP